MRYYSVEDGVKTAKKTSAVCLVLTENVCNPFCETIKSIFRYKNIPFIGINQNDVKDGAYTGNVTAPQAIWENVAPRITNLEILIEAENRHPNPRLLPNDGMDRALCLGLCQEIGGPYGFCYHVRSFRMLETWGLPYKTSGDASNVGSMGYKYGATDEVYDNAPQRMVNILNVLSKQLHKQLKENDSHYYIGNQVTAVDIYSAWAMAMVSPEFYDCEGTIAPIPFFQKYTWSAENYVGTKWEQTFNAVDPILLQHRDMMFKNHLQKFDFIDETIPEGNSSKFLGAMLKKKQEERQAKM